MREPLSRFRHLCAVAVPRGELELVAEAVLAEKPDPVIAEVVVLRREADRVVPKPAVVILGVPVQRGKLCTETLFDIRTGRLELELLDVDIGLAVHHADVDDFRHPHLARLAQLDQAVRLCLEHGEGGFGPSFAERFPQ